MGWTSKNVKACQPCRSIPRDMESLLGTIVRQPVRQTDKSLPQPGSCSWPPWPSSAASSPSQSCWRSCTGGSADPPPPPSPVAGSPRPVCQCKPVRFQWAPVWRGWRGRQKPRSELPICCSSSPAGQDGCNPRHLWGRATQLSCGEQRSSKDWAIGRKLFQDGLPPSTGSCPRGEWYLGERLLFTTMAVTMILMNTKDNTDLSKSRVLVAGGRRGRVLNPAPRQSVVEPEHRQPAGHWKSTFEFSI